MTGLTEGRSAAPAGDGWRVPVIDAGPRHHEEIDTARRFTATALAAGAVAGAAEVERWLAAERATGHGVVEPIAFGAMPDWAFDPDTGDLRHRTGRFFSIEGLRVDTGNDWVPHWSQPIINQPEVGILGIVVKAFDGVLHCLMQSKVEPGNINGHQLSPTVQATRSNYTRAHGGAEVPYLDLFTDRRRSRILVDVLQSEQGAWFYRKRNRNMVVEITGDLPVRPHFRWLPLGVVLSLLRYDDAVNMDARTVLACLPFAAPASHIGDDLGDTALAWSLDQRSGAVHRMSSIISWLNSAKTRHEVLVRPIPLSTVDGWHRVDESIQHDQGRHFRVRAFSVVMPGREVHRWSQPLLQPVADGIVAVLIKSIGGVPHLLMHARFEPGHLDVAELAPTVQCIPANYAGVPVEQHPRFLDYVSTVDPARIRYDAMQSEEGGRFYQARNRYLAIDVDDDFPSTEPDGYRWVTLGQLAALLRHSYYIDIQARSLIASLHGLWGGRR